MNHLSLIGIVVVLVLVSFFMRPSTYERFEDKAMTEDKAVIVTEKKSEPTSMDTLNEVRKLMKCDGSFESKDPQVTYDAIQTLLQCKKVTPSA